MCDWDFGVYSKFMLIGYNFMITCMIQKCKVTINFTTYCITMTAYAVKTV